MKYERQYIISRGINQVVDLYRCFEKLGAYHPLIKGVAYLGDDSAANRIYVLREQPFSWLPICIKYKAIVSYSKECIEYDLCGIPFLDAKIRLRFEELASKETRVTYTLTTRDIFLAKDFFRWKMFKAHDELIAKLNEGSSSRA